MLEPTWNASKEGAAGCHEAFWATGLGALVRCLGEPGNSQLRIQKGCQFKDNSKSLHFGPLEGPRPWSLTDLRSLSSLPEHTGWRHT